MVVKGGFDWLVSKGELVKWWLLQVDVCGQQEDDTNCSNYTHND